MSASVYTRVYNSVHVGTQLYTHVYTKQHTVRAQKLYLWERGVPPKGTPHLYLYYSPLYSSLS